MQHSPCNLCGNPATVINSDDGTYICNHCLSVAGTCHLCTQGCFCEFETNPDPMPKQVQKIIQQGNVTMQTIVKNPSRVAAFCIDKCPCFSHDYGCSKEIGTCNLYIERRT